ncbi:MAG: hypothetical protein LQ346_003490 [Caloplaca aetnensis]|nr:MAG: hypothetical protein LQ346_003490 [Caloplaca aetnensis]
MANYNTTTQRASRPGRPHRQQCDRCSASGHTCQHDCVEPLIQLLAPLKEWQRNFDNEAVGPLSGSAATVRKLFVTIFAEQFCTFQQEESRLFVGKVMEELYLSTITIFTPCVCHTLSATLVKQTSRPSCGLKRFVATTMDNITRGALAGHAADHVVA